MKKNSGQTQATEQINIEALVKHGRQLHSAAIGDMFIRLFSAITNRRSKTREQDHGLHNALGSHSR